ncbi:hypothetical protein DPMN_190642 [Dreissena polymorpha]|uniref:Uncharacterized protein n=1 Tax=Dreissena polymorpha TaxID=45954 RepID=A0A9D4BCM0_DREPO|nr:hypothetical protein DPMN_190642 [Dreissena polymorpha]
MLSSIDVTSEENTHVHYHEIADTQIEPMTGGSTLQNNMDRTHHQSYTASPIENVDSIILTQATTTYNISHAPRCHFSQFVTRMKSDVSSPSTYSTTAATKAGKRFPFLALAEINLSDGKNETCELFQRNTLLICYNVRPNWNKKALT